MGKSEGWKLKEESLDMLGVINVWSMCLGRQSGFDTEICKHGKCLKSVVQVKILDSGTASGFQTVQILDTLDYPRLFI